MGAHTPEFKCPHCERTLTRDQQYSPNWTVVAGPGNAAVVMSCPYTDCRKALGVYGFPPTPS